MVIDRILLTAHSQFRGLQMGLAKRLKAEHGSRIYIYCATEQEKTHWEKGGDVFAEVLVSRTLYDTARQPVTDPGDLLKRARKYETELGTTINELAITDRHLGRGYALGGFHHPRSQISERTSYHQMVAAFVSEIEYWAKEFDEKSPTLVLGYSKVQALTARQRAVPYRLLAGSRYKTFYQWSDNEYLENPRVKEEFDRIEGTETDEITVIKEPYQAHMDIRANFINEVRLLPILKYSLRTILQFYYWKLRRYEKARGYFLSDRLRYPWSRRSDTLKLSGKMTRTLSSLEGQPFVYYPLHTEPEMALQCLSPEYFYQLSCIAALSRDLPAGVLLAVKETFQATGRRPRDFYEQILEFKNVVMLEMMEFGPNVIRACDAVATITGTAGFEASVMGKPVIAFGQHNLYNFLDSVSVVTEESQLKGYLAKVLAGDFDQAKAVRDGNRYLNAVVQCSFDLQGYDITAPDRITDELNETLYRALFASLPEIDADAKQVQL